MVHGRQVTRDVTTGLTSGGLTQVTRGLTAGDLVVVNILRLSPGVPGGGPGGGVLPGPGGGLKQRIINLGLAGG